MKWVTILLGILLIVSCQQLQETTHYYANGNPKETYSYYLDDRGKIIFEGTRTLWDEVGNIREESEWSENQLHGTRTLWFDNGQKKEENQWIHGNQSGVQRTWYLSGQLKCQSEWIDNRKDGKEICWYQNGHKQWEQEFAVGQPTGPKQLWDPTGTLIASDSPEYPTRAVTLHKIQLAYESGQRAAEYTYYKEDGRQVLHGAFTSWYKSGNLKRTLQYAMGKKQGTEVEYHPNGNKKRLTEWYWGSRDGREYTWWTEEGLKKSEEHYKMGTREGLSRTWYANGNPKTESYYTNDTLNYKSIHWYANGFIKGVYSYNMGKFHGDVRENYRDGSPALSCKYSEGVPEKPCKKFPHKTEPEKYLTPTAPHEGLGGLEPPDMQEYAELCRDLMDQRQAHRLKRVDDLLKEGEEDLAQLEMEIHYACGFYEKLRARSEMASAEGTRKNSEVL